MDQTSGYALIVFFLGVCYSTGIIKDRGFRIWANYLRAGFWISLLVTVTLFLVSGDSKSLYLLLAAEVVITAVALVVAFKPRLRTEDPRFPWPKARGHWD